MRSKSCLIVSILTFLSFIFSIVTTFFMVKNNYMNNINIISMVTIIMIVLSIINVLYISLKFKTGIIRSITKKRIIFHIIGIILIFLLMNVIFNKEWMLDYVLCFSSFILSISSLYYLLSLYSISLGLRSQLLKIKKVLSYIHKQKSSNVILLDTPIHSNLGDAAIALAEIEFLHKELKIQSFIEITAQDLEGMEKIYAFFTKKDKLILVHGGGFLGDIWPSEENRFRKIVKYFSKNKIIVFPQTIYYDLSKESSREFYEESKKIYSSHKNLSIFARERKSYDFLKSSYPDNSIYLVPDIVVGLNVRDMKYNRKDILLCMRSDIEKKVEKKEEEALINSIRKKYPNETIKKTDTVIDRNILPDNRVYEVNLKLEEFAQSKLVITDRLHGMVFAAITNTPCIALGNSSGKVKGVYEWIKENDYIYYLDNITNISKVLDKLNINKKYKYQMTKIEKEFKPLIEKIKKEINYGSKSN